MAKSNADSPTTQRAYTLRLRGADANDHSWRDALWATHEAVNKGAKVFGDWLLTLRGGLCHTLADAKVSQGKGKPDRDPTAEERRDRRILLVLSWLSVESAPNDGDPHKAFVIASGKDDSQSRRNEKVVRALREILEKRGVKGTDLDGWATDCEPSLSAAIRDDAVWVNRSGAFDGLCNRLTGMNRAYAEQTIRAFFGATTDFLSIPSPNADAETETGVIPSDGPEFRTLARQWISTNFGTGVKSDTDQIAQRLKVLASANLSQFDGQPKVNLLSHLVTLLGGSLGADPDASLRVAVGWKTGRHSKGRLAASNLPDTLTTGAISVLQTKFKEEADDKCERADERKVPSWMPEFQKDIEIAVGMPFVAGRNMIGEFSVMLDHAARRVSIGHSWIKRAESERQKFKADARRIDAVPAEAKAWLDQFCQARSGTSGALDAYRIRKRAVEGWKEVVAKWDRTAYKTAEDRVAAAREVQADPDIAKFGDIQLFEALAEDDAVCVWRVNGETTAQPLIDYSAATDAEAKQRRFKVPAYRHPDPLAHPVFCDFGNSRWDIRFAVHEAAKVAARKKRVAPGEDNWLKERQALRMGLWDGQKLDDSLPLRWSCKRLMADLALRQDVEASTKATPVTRADRLGRAAAGAPAGSSVEILGVFNEDHWNGRLQAPRAQLDAIAQYVAKHGWDAKAGQMRSRIRWLVSFSVKLQPAGPWIEYAARFSDDAPAKPFVSRKGKYAVKHQTNDKRQGHAELVLARLPGLRVLSVDLGHRYAAACTVWETLTVQQINAACKAANHASPAESDLFLHLTTTGANGSPRTTIYRRIGADQVEDIDRNTGEVRQIQHPAPWARLERQFLIKLPGEDRPARKASPDELDTIRRLEEALGRKRPTDDGLPGRIDELLAAGVDTARLALRRLGDAARIAYAFKPGADKLMPGGGRASATAQDRQSMILDALVVWHGLWNGDRWTNPWAAQQWDTHIKPLLSVDLPSWTEDSGESRRQHRGKIEELLKTVAEKLAKGDTAALHALWADDWRTRDAGWRGKNGHLRTLRALLLRRGPAADTPAAWNVGGLSLTRIATLKLLYQVQKAYHMRPEPEDPRRNVPAKGEDELRDFGRRILGAMERMREQRVKQLASRIAEAALGIGRMKPAEGPRDRLRPRERVDEPCHAVVIENLTNYRPEETRARRENRQLMSWSAGKVKKYLSEACQLHGLHLREVPAGYTSRQDSRTGAPGIRCTDVPVTDFMTKPWWRRLVNIAKKKTTEGKGDARDCDFADLDAKWSAMNEAQRKAAPPLRIPVNGGELFVSADPHSPSAKGLQADLNAAANIALKALLDPDWPGKWWYVPCSTKDGRPSQDKVKGAACIDLGEPLFDPLSESAPKSGKTKKKEIVNVWRDPSTTSMNGPWQPTPAYWNMVRSRVVDVLRGANGLTTPTEKTVESEEVPW